MDPDLNCLIINVIPMNYSWMRLIQSDKLPQHVDLVSANCLPHCPGSNRDDFWVRLVIYDE